VDRGEGRVGDVRRAVLESATDDYGRAFESIPMPWTTAGDSTMQQAIRLAFLLTNSVEVKV
jgi:hypothetical protein